MQQVPHIICNRCCPGRMAPAVAESTYGKQQVPESVKRHSGRPISSLDLFCLHGKSELVSTDPISVAVCEGSISILANDVPVFSAALERVVACSKAISDGPDKAVEPIGLLFARGEALMWLGETLEVHVREKLCEQSAEVAGLRRVEAGHHLLSADILVRHFTIRALERGDALNGLFFEARSVRQPDKVQELMQHLQNAEDHHR